MLDVLRQLPEVSVNGIDLRIQQATTCIGLTVAGTAAWVGAQDALRGCVWCGLCARWMLGHCVRELTCYRCWFPPEYALADRVEHQLSVYLRENAVVGEVDKWIRLRVRASTPERNRRQPRCGPAATIRHMSEAEIKSIVDRLADIARVLIDADPEDKAEVFRQLGLKLTYHPGRKLVEANVQLAQFGFFDGVRGGT